MPAHAQRDKQRLTELGEHYFQVSFSDPSIAVLINHVEGLFELFDLLRREHCERPAGGFPPIMG